MKHAKAYEEFNYNYIIQRNSSTNRTGAFTIKQHPDNNVEKECGAPVSMYPDTTFVRFFVPISPNGGVCFSFISNIIEAICLILKHEKRSTLFVHIPSLRHGNKTRKAKLLGTKAKLERIALMV